METPHPREAALAFTAVVGAYLVSKGVIGGDDSTFIQAAGAAAITLASAFGIRSLRPAKPKRAKRKASK